MRILLTFICLLITLCASARKHYLAEFETSADTCIYVATDTTNLFQALETRIRLPKLKESDKPHHYYGFRWNSPHNKSQVEILVTPLLIGHGSSWEHPCVEIAAYTIIGEKRQLIASQRLEKGIGFGKSYNVVAVEQHKGGGVTVKAGHDYLNNQLQLPSAYSIADSLCFFTVGDAEVKHLVFEEIADPKLALLTPWTIERLCSYFAQSNDLREGFWKFLDRSTDEGYARMGGEYLLALVADEKGGYQILYISGAVTNGRNWEVGMLKGSISPTIFAGNFNLQWFDSTMKSAGDEMYAQFDQAGAILTLNFPLLKSSIRFSKVIDEISIRQDN